MTIPPDEQEEGFPWLIIAGILIVGILAGGWLMRMNKQHNASFNALEQQRVAQKLVLDQERDKIIEMTKELDALKGQIAAKKAGDPKVAVARYNALAAEQRDEHDKVKKLADEYNQTISKIHELQ